MNYFKYLFNPERTYKRETVLVLITLVCVVSYHVFFTIPASDVQRYEQLYSGLVWAVFILVAAIFGIQLGNRVVTNNSAASGTTIEEATSRTVVSTPAQPAG